MIEPCKLGLDQLSQQLEPESISLQIAAKDHTGVISMIKPINNINQETTEYSSYTSEGSLESNIFVPEVDLEEADVIDNQILEVKISDTSQHQVADILIESNPIVCSLGQINH